MARGKRAPALAPRLIIMAKRPRAGAVKSRLARDIGVVHATRFYRTALRHTLTRLGVDPRWRTVLAVTPGMAVEQSCWPSNVARIAQGEGGLGTRMQRLFNAMPPGPVIIIGSDIPAIRADEIARAFRLLGGADAVFGPADDGGYWLVGLKRSSRKLSPFAGVPWSTKHALAATIKNLRGRILAYVSTLDDVDTAADLHRQRRVAERFITRAS
jgi:rSAM/selenodomain-associated transferase 1